MSKATPLIIDIGSSSIKAGFGGQEKPQLISPNYIGVPKYPKYITKPIILNLAAKQESVEMIGNDCSKYFGVVKIKYPVEHGIFNDTKDITTILDYIYNKMDMNDNQIRQHPLLITEPLLNSRKNRKEIASTLFETFCAPSLFFASQPILSLFATSCTSGAVLETGDGVTQSCAIYEGYSIPNSYQRINFGGRQVTEYLQYLLNKKGHNLKNSDSFEIVKRIKEELCFLNNNNNESEKISKSYTLPDDNVIEVGEEVRLAPELLFDPGLNKFEFPSIQEMIVNSINKTSINLRLKLYGSILLAGGNINTKGIKERIHKEIKKLAPANSKVRLHVPSKPENLCWVGGNVISSLEIFKEMRITLNDWTSKGEEILFSKSI